jgi:ABC-type transporter Mla subunit MlaD
MSVKTNNFKLGLFTLFGIALLVTGVLAFGAWSSFEKKSLFETYVVGDVSGLSVGSAVEFRGVHVGKVSKIGFSWNEYQTNQPGWVVVTFEMRDDVFTSTSANSTRDQLQAAVEHGLRARLKAQGVTGTSIISLEYLDPAEHPAASVPWTPLNPYIPSAPGLFGDLLASLQKALHQFEHVDIADLNQSIETDLKSVNRVLDKVEQVDLQSLSTNATALLQELRQSNTKLQAFIADTDDTVKKLQLEKLSRDSDTLVTQLQETVAKLEPGLTGDLSSANQTLDSVNQTLAKARQAIENMDEVLDELKQYPSGFILGKPPARLKEVQSTNK